MKADRVSNVGLAQQGRMSLLILALASIAIGVIGFSESLLELVSRWNKQEEYSHGYLIPFIAFWLLWSRREALMASIGRPSWAGPALIVLAAVMHILGKLSALFFMSQLGFVVALFGIALGIGGYSLLRVVFIPIVFLIFAIPLPYFIDATLSYKLQLISSQLGTDFIRLIQIPVFLEGNVIDLGVYKLQVVEACSGLRYLYPLMSLGFLAAYLFQAPVWQRAAVFLSTIPITIVMNSFRIGIVGVLVNYFGPQDADGFLHMFEGWIIFLACSGILVLEVYALARFTLGKGFFEAFYPPKITAREIERPASVSAATVACPALLCAATIAAFVVSARQEIIPQRAIFATFPTALGAWTGHPGSLDTATADFLGLTDYIISDYRKRDSQSVNFYVAYYASQRSGVAPHSPSVCIPGNGWQITSFERTSFHDVGSAPSLPFNRAIISRGNERQLVYYWFDERGRSVANEYLAKLYLLEDAIFRNRTDGALIRLITPIYATENEGDADKRLTDFAQAVVPVLSGYLPPAMLSNVKPAMKPSAANRS